MVKQQFEQQGINLEFLMAGNYHCTMGFKLLLDSFNNSHTT